MRQWNSSCWDRRNSDSEPVCCPCSLPNNKQAPLVVSEEPKNVNEMPQWRNSPAEKWQSCCFFSETWKEDDANSMSEEAQPWVRLCLRPARRSRSWGSWGTGTPVCVLCIRASFLGPTQVATRGTRAYWGFTSFFIVREWQCEDLLLSDLLTMWRRADLVHFIPQTLRDQQFGKVLGQVLPGRKILRQFILQVGKTSFAQHTSAPNRTYIVVSHWKQVRQGLSVIWAKGQSHGSPEGPGTRHKRTLPREGNLVDLK